MPLTEIIHVTAAYSNAVLAVVLPQVNDYAGKLNLPVPLPITANEIQEFRVGRLQGFVMGGLWLTNHCEFAYGNGYVYGFTMMTNNPWRTDDPTQAWPRYAGAINMTTNEAITFARSELVKLGYDLKVLHADVAPSSFEGGYQLREGPFPYCQIKWLKEAKTFEEKADASTITVQINMHDKTLLGLNVVSRKLWQPEPDIEPKPELESEYRQRTQARMYFNTSAPALPPKKE